jgi:hypothetical protein
MNISQTYIIIYLISAVVFGIPAVLALWIAYRDPGKSKRQK